MAAHELEGVMAGATDEPDLRGPAVIVTGGVIGGFEFEGPFETIDDALCYWQDSTLGGSLGVPCSVVLLKKPNPIT